MTPHSSARALIRPGMLSAETELGTRIVVVALAVREFGPVTVIRTV